MDEPSERVTGNILCLVTYGERKAIVSAKAEKLLQSIREKFGIGNEDIHIQIFSSEWNEWVDVLPEDVPYKSKLKLVVQQSEPHCGVGSSPSRPLTNKKHGESSSHVEPTDEVEGAKLPSSPGSSSKEVSFSNVNHPLLIKLRGGKKLDKKETTELVKKVFHIVTEHTFFPSAAELAAYVKKLLQEFPILKENNYKEAKKHWMKLLQNKFCSFRNEVIKREQKPKVDAGTETGLGNKPWQVWHPKYQKPPDNFSVFQDMSPIVLSIKHEFSKPEPDQEKIERLMRLTYQYRRSFIINMAPKVICVQEVYPALFHCNQICKEFIWITGKENDKMFFKNLEDYAHIIYDLTKGCATRRFIDHSRETAKSKKVPYNWKTAALLLLPHLFKENHNFLWFQNQRFDAEQTEPYIKCNASMKAVAEGDGVFQIFAESTLLAETNDFAVAVECFLASFFIFLMEYRADLKNTLQLLQSFFYEYDDPQEEDLHPRVIEVAEMLKNKMKHQTRFVRS